MWNPKTLIILLLSIAITFTVFFIIFNERKFYPINFENSVTIEENFHNKTLENNDYNYIEEQNQHKNIDIITSEEHEKQSESVNSVFIQPSFVNDKLNLSNFNYEGKCREAFKYKRNSERDLIFTGLKYNEKEKWRKQKKEILFSVSLMNNTIPFAKKVCVVYDDNNEIKTFMEEIGFEVIFIKIDKVKDVKLNAAIDRFIQLKKYLNDHEGEFDRVALIDARDVFFFADGFQTISENEVVFSEECVQRSQSDLYCIDFSQYWNYKWMKECYNVDLANKYKNENKHVTNVGTIIGGIKPFRQLLEVFVKEIQQKKDVLYLWGIDNAMINYLRYSGAFKNINFVASTFSQRLAFIPDKGSGYSYDKQLKSITNTLDGCSPIIRHKLLGNEDFQMGF